MKKYRTKFIIFHTIYFYVIYHVTKKTYVNKKKLTNEIVITNKAQDILAYAYLYIIVSLKNFRFMSFYIFLKKEKLACTVILGTVSINHRHGNVI